MRTSWLKAAAALLPFLSHALVLPNELTHRGHGYEKATSFHETKGTVIEHRRADSLIRFKIPCPDCTDLERSAIEDAVLSLQVLPSDQDICSFESTSGLHFNGEPLILGNITQNPLKRSRKGVSKLPFELPGSNSEFNVLWENYCSCLVKNADGQCIDYEYVLVLELPKVGRNHHPGFTISYKQFKEPQLLRLSGFPDPDGVHQFGHSSHWRSPSLVNVVEEAWGLHFPEKAFPLAPSDSFHELSRAGISPASVVSTVVEQVSATLASEPAVGTSTTSNRPRTGHTRPHVPVATNPEAGSSIWPHCGHAAASALRSGLAKLESKAQDVAQLVVQGLSHLPVDLHRDQARIKFQKDAPTPVMYDQLDDAPTVNTQATYSPITSRSPVKDTLEAALDDQSVQKGLINFCVVAVILVIIFLAVFAFFLIHRDPRRRAERAARREERRNKRLYASAARRERIKRFFRRLGGRNPAPKASTVRAGDYPDIAVEPKGIDWDGFVEKRLARNSLEERPGRDSVRDALRAFRHAHRHVDGLVCAEEGHFSGDSSGESGGEGSKRRDARRARRERGLRAGRTRRRPSDTASEKTAPPPYEEFEVAVVDGMQYVRAVETTPDSSVVCTSTRGSAVDSDEEGEAGKVGIGAVIGLRAHGESRPPDV